MPMGYAGLALAPSVAFTLSGMVGLGYVNEILVLMLEGRAAL